MSSASRLGGAGGPRLCPLSRLQSCRCTSGVQSKLKRADRVVGVDEGNSRTSGCTAWSLSSWLVKIAGWDFSPFLPSSLFHFLCSLDRETPAPSWFRMASRETKIIHLHFLPSVPFPPPTLQSSLYFLITILLFLPLLICARPVPSPFFSIFVPSFLFLLVLICCFTFTFPIFEILPVSHLSIYLNPPLPCHLPILAGRGSSPLTWPLRP